MSPQGEQCSHAEMVGLHEHMEAQMSACRRLTDSQLAEIVARIKAMDKATELAYAAMQERLQGMNEFRQALNDQNKSFIGRAEWQLAHDRVLGDIQSLRESRAESQGEASQNSVLLSYVVGGMGLLVAAVGLAHSIWG